MFLFLVLEKLFYADVENCESFKSFGYIYIDNTVIFKYFIVCMHYMTEMSEFKSELRVPNRRKTPPLAAL